VSCLTSKSAADGESVAPILSDSLSPSMRPKERQADLDGPFTLECIEAELRLRGLLFFDYRRHSLGDRVTVRKRPARMVDINGGWWGRTLPGAVLLAAIRSLPVPATGDQLRDAIKVSAFPQTRFEFRRAQ
jgi:hypothetical protein